MNKKSILWIAHCAIGAICGYVCLYAAKSQARNWSELVVYAVGCYLLSKILICGLFLEKKDKKQS